MGSFHRSPRSVTDIGKEQTHHCLERGDVECGSNNHTQHLSSRKRRAKTTRQSVPVLRLVFSITVAFIVVQIVGLYLVSQRFHQEEKEGHDYSDHKKKKEWHGGSVQTVRLGKYADHQEKNEGHDDSVHKKKEGHDGVQTVGLGGKYAEKEGHDDSVHEKKKESEGHGGSVQTVGLGKYADRHIRKFMQIVNDPDCANPEIDASSSDFDPAKAAEIYGKCRLLVLKNAFDRNFLSEFRDLYTNFLNGLKSGRISTDGTTTTGDSFFFLPRERSRWEIILPENLAHPQLIANEKIAAVLRDPRVLSSVSLRSLQSIVSEGGEHSASGQQWHYDQNFLFGGQQDGLKTYGLAGHDLPSYATTVGVPMLDMTREHGPTEFCMGSSAVAGVSVSDPLVEDKSLVEEGSLWHQYAEHVQNGDSCAPNFWISPLLNFGDVVLFDYAIRHRGGWNVSPDMRAVLLLIYSRNWFDDVNFGNTVHKASFHEDERVAAILGRTRLAVPNFSDGQSGDGKDNADDDDSADGDDNADGDDSADGDDNADGDGSADGESSLQSSPKDKEHEELKDIKDFRPQESSFLYDFEASHKVKQFVASNADIDDAILYHNGNIVGPLPAGTSKTVMGAFGDLMEVWSSGRVVGKFKLQYFGQFVFSKDMKV